MKSDALRDRFRHVAEAILFSVQLLVLIACANCPLALTAHSAGWMLAIPVILFLVLNIVPIVPCERFVPSKLRKTRRGVTLLWLFALALLPTVGIQLFLAFRVIPSDGWGRWLASAAIGALVLAAVFWHGMITVYLCSSQLGLYRRAVGLLLGMVPVLNMIQLVKIIRTVTDEVRVEVGRCRLDHRREAEKLCATRYPLLMVHGVFFRDSASFNYWGRIPEALEKNGATVFYGEHESAASVRDAAEELSARIREIVEQTGCEKVNIIAHSKGGLDCRYAIARCGVAPLVASLTTVNTPHRGCEFADELLDNIPNSVQVTVASGYNTAMRAVGDQNPDFMAAVRDLTASACRKRNEEIGMALPQGIVSRSVGSRLNRARGGRFPLNMTYALVKRFDGPNDGLVSESSFRFGDEYRLLTVKGDRGISHGDMIDLNRENIPEFDVREFYVSLVNDLKTQGL